MHHNILTGMESAFTPLPKPQSSCTQSIQKLQQYILCAVEVNYSLSLNYWKGASNLLCKVLLHGQKDHGLPIYIMDYQSQHAQL